MFTTGPDCTLCERVRPHLERSSARWGFVLQVVDLRTAPAPASDYVFRAPVVHLDGVVVAEGRVDLARLQRRIERAVGKHADRTGQGGGEG